MSSRAAGAFVEFEGDWTKIQRGVQGQARGLEKTFNSSFSRIAKFATTALVGVGLGKVFKDSFKEAEDAQRVNRLTAAVLKSTGGAAQVSSKQVGALATSLSAMAGIDDEVIQSGENVLLTFTNIRNAAGKGNDIFNQATEAAVNLSAALGTDLQGSVIQVGKALNDPIKGVTALQRVGVSFTKQQKDQIKTLVESGRTLDAQKLILRELGAEFGGAAAAAATPSQKIGVAFKNLEEALGGLILPLFEKFASFVTVTVAPALTSFVALLQNLGAVAAVAFKVGFGGGSVAGVDGWLSVIARLGAVLRGFIDFIKGDVASAGVQLGKVFGLSEDDPRVKGFISALTSVRAAIVSVIEFVAEHWKPVLAAAAAALLVFTAPVVAVIAGLVALYVRFGVVRAAIARLGEVISHIDWGSIFATVADAFAPIIDAFARLGVSVAHFAVAVWPVLQQAIPPVLAALKTVALVAGGTLVVVLRVLAGVVDFLARHMTILGPALLAAAGGFAAFKAVKGTISLFHSVAKAATDTIGSIRKAAGEAQKFGKSTVELGPKIAKLFRGGSDTLRLRFWQLRDAAKATATRIADGVKALITYGKQAIVAAVNIGRQVAAFVAQKAAMLAAAIAQKVLTAAQWLLNAAMSANPIGLIVVALVALGVAVFEAYKHFGPFRAAVDAAWQILQSTFHWIVKNWPLLLGILTAPFGGLLVLGVVKNFSKIKSVVLGVLQWVKKHWPLLVGILAAPFGGLLVVAVVKNFDKIKAVVSGVLDWVRTNWPVLLAILTAPFGGLFVLAIVKNFDKIKAVFSGLIDWVKQHWPLLLAGILAVSTGGLSLVVALFISHFDQIKRFVGVAVDAVIGFFRRFGPTILAFATGGLSLLVVAFVSHFGQIRSFVGRVVGDIVGFFTAMPSRIIGLLGAIVGAATRIAQGIVGTLRSIVSSGISEIVGFFAGLPGRILAFLGQIAAAGLSIGSAILNGLKDGLTGAVGFVTDIGKAIANAAIGFINTIIDDINNALEFTIKGPGPLPDFHIDPPDIPHIPHLHAGGTFHAPGGGEGLALLQSGEFVFTPAQLAALTKKDDGKSVGPRVLVTGNTIQSWDDADLARRLDDRIRRAELLAGI